MFRFADKVDVALMTVGTIFSILIGTALPIFANITGGMIDSFSANTDRYSEAKRNLFYFIYLGSGALIVAMVMFTTWSIAGERQGIKYRK